MEVVNPVGRNFSLENDADYSTLTAACRCSNSVTAKQEGARNLSCGCSDGAYNSLYTNIYKG